jgi:hypothetical protein
VCSARKETQGFVLKVSKNRNTHIACDTRVCGFHVVSKKRKDLMRTMSDDGSVGVQMVPPPPPEEATIETLHSSWTKRDA